jgi:branched-chain amino acid transport system ATP-binding protein
MLAVGRALMSDPKLLLVDEASMGLAPNLVEQLFDALAAVNQEGTSILVVEQFIGMALRYTQRAYVLAKGSVAIEGMSADLASSEEVVGAYLGHDTPPADAEEEPPAPAAEVVPLDARKPRKSRAKVAP